MTVLDGARHNLGARTVRLPWGTPLVILASISFERHGAHWAVRLLRPPPDQATPLDAFDAAQRAAFEQQRWWFVGVRATAQVRTTAPNGSALFEATATRWGVPCGSLPTDGDGPRLISLDDALSGPVVEEVIAEAMRLAFALDHATGMVLPQFAAALGEPR